MWLKFADLANELNFPSLILSLWKFWFGSFSLGGPILVKRNLVINFFGAKRILVQEKNVGQKVLVQKKRLCPKKMWSKKWVQKILV